MNETLLCVIGPTASGKTAVALALAERLGGEIVSADARQVYRRLDIGTAKPTAGERGRARHHLLDVVDPDGEYHAGRFVREAEDAIEEIRGRGRRPIVAGGTGLYVRALVRGLDVSVGRHPEVRAVLEARAEAEGLLSLHDELRRVDPESAAVIHSNDRVRIIRALEVYRVSGETRSGQHRRGEGKVRRRHLLAALDPPRAILYERIDDRFDTMMEEGFLDEVRRLLRAGYDPGLPCFRSPGYREMIAHLRGGLDLEEAVERGKREHRRYAKRQPTWIRGEEEAVRFDPTGPGGVRAAAEAILQALRGEEGRGPGTAEGS
ncbi:MAG: tRNA (adenosine(37)-N6)-dimethylallyltransferase MiaA [Candidatus Eisenbacteria bacterium]